MSVSIYWKKPVISCSDSDKRGDGGRPPQKPPQTPTPTQPQPKK